MTFESYFRACSYATIACGVLALAVSGGVGAVLALAFAAVLVVSWKASGTRWQLSERAGMFVVLLSLPAFYLDWNFQRSSAADATGQIYAGVTALVHFTLLLSSIKLLQVKSDRDWLFLYLISFFEVLLAAGLSASPTFLVSLGLYVFCALLAVVCFEMRKARRAVVPENQSRLLVANDPKRLRRSRGDKRDASTRSLRRLPVAAACLFALIIGLAFPVFLITPRAAENMLGMPGGTASSGFVGFSERVTLGDIGRLNQSNELVMRVRVEGPNTSGGRPLRWRGVALDQFNGRRWRQTPDPGSPYQNTDNLFRFGTTEDLSRLTTQTFFIEPVDTPVIFAAPRAIALQGGFPFVRRDRDDGLASRMHSLERITYTVYSDTYEPPPERLREDPMAYTPGLTTKNLRRPAETYQQLPANLDARIGSLARTVIKEAGAKNGYDAARAIEAHLSENAYGGNYSYSLDMRAGGNDPLADFLFNVRAGHCEYFATAMTVMLRTLHVSARLVNGFQTGEYNDAADAYVVRQADAHSWVEVYFPETDSWVTFDPTPADGRAAGSSGEGLSGRLRRYADALELFWIQHVVAYDRQSQRSLARTVQGQISSATYAAFHSADGIGQRISSLFGGGSASALGVFTSPLFAGPFALAFVFGAFVFLRRKGLPSFKRRGAKARAPEAVVVEFYKRMTAALDSRGLRRNADQTPLEFAETIGTPEVLSITRAYNRVRFGARGLSEAEAAEVERHLHIMEENGSDK